MLSPLPMEAACFICDASFWPGIQPSAPKQRDVHHVGAEAALMAWPATGRQLHVDPSWSQPDSARLARFDRPQPTPCRPARSPPFAHDAPTGLATARIPPESPALLQAWHETNGWMRADKKDVGVASAVASGEIGVVGFARKNRSLPMLGSRSVMGARRRWVRGRRRCPDVTAWSSSFAADHCRHRPVARPLTVATHSSSPATHRMAAMATIFFGDGGAPF
ncbi:hypothetical protein ACLOJK_035678 [Asimina triloba]